jgi:hypothetical protein
MGCFGCGVENNNRKNKTTREKESDNIGQKLNLAFRKDNMTE